MVACNVLKGLKSHSTTRKAREIVRTFENISRAHITQPGNARASSYDFLGTLIRESRDLVL